MKEMKKPDCIIDNGGYEEPNVFENESESILFDAYLEQQKYIEYLESKVNNGVLDDVIKCQCNHKIEDRFPTELLMKECEDCNGVL